MILGDVSADKQVLSDVFGVASFEELEHGIFFLQECNSSNLDRSLNIL
jgi:hypothetical protein